MEPRGEPSALANGDAPSPWPVMLRMRSPTSRRTWSRESALTLRRFEHASVLHVPELRSFLDVFELRADFGLEGGVDHEVLLEDRRHLSAKLDVFVVDLVDVRRAME